MTCSSLNYITWTPWLACCSSLTLVLAFHEGSHISPKMNFLPFWPCTKFHIPLRHQAFVKRSFIDFLRKIYEWKMKTPLESRHQFCWVYRVYGIQNDRLNLRINEFLLVLKTMHCSQRYLQFFDLFFYLFCYSALFSKPLKSRYSWDRAGRFEYHKPYELNKIGDNFLMDFSFFTYRFFMKTLWKFISQMPDALGVCGTLIKVKKEGN